LRAIAQTDQEVFPYLPKPAYNVLRRLTGETPPDVTLSIALRDLVRLRLEAVQSVIADYKKKYGIPFNEIKEAWQAGCISAQYSYTVEEDYWTWEAAVNDKTALEELAASMA
jgi:hypothetical protein